MLIFFSAKNKSRKKRDNAQRSIKEYVIKIIFRDVVFDKFVDCVISLRFRRLLVEIFYFSQFMLIWRFLKKRRSRLLFFFSAMTIIFVMILFCRKKFLFCLRTILQQWKISRQTKCRFRHRQVRFCDLTSTIIWIFQLRNRIFRCSTCCNWKKSWSTWSTRRKSWKHDCKRE